MICTKKNLSSLIFLAQLIKVEIWDSLKLGPTSFSRMEKQISPQIINIYFTKWQLKQAFLSNGLKWNRYQ